MALYVVLGPPAAGKSTWVQEHAKCGDIVIDYDILAQALTASGADAHRHEKIVQSVAHQARSSAIATALRYIGQVDVYVIHSAPRAEAMAKYHRHHARFVTIDPGRDVVLARCKTMRSAWAIGVAERWYAERNKIVTTAQSASRSW
jgi:predicted kinase